MADKIAIVGLGLIGGSIGLALDAARKRDKHLTIEIVGHDRDPEVANKAKRMGAIDRAEWNLLSAVERAAMVIIATPVLAVRTVLEQITPALAPGATVTDTASTKAEVLRWAAELLPDTVTFVGGHPMAGKELPGIEHAEATLFQGAVYCLCPALNAEQSRVETMAAFVEVLGARPYFVDPHEHDGLVAGISHLPMVIAAALVSATTADPAWREMRKLAASGYRDTTRLASGEPQMNLDICLTNRGPLVSWIDRYIDELQRYRQLIAEGEAASEQLAREFLRVQTERDRWAYGKRDDEGSERIERISFTQLLMGDRFARLTDYLRRSERK
ncbi:MAG: prephenate dehydrogenase/arogenate dehydrogenase family protein [Chloroflexi bacterium]|nr:prephenate dehydrogenase/arogenate dehydrogenase family protein [Chloroflexota bacterium]